MEELNAKLRATEHGLTSFIKSMVWCDMQNELNIWEAMANSEYADTKNMEEVARIQGRIEAINYLRSLPEMLLDGLRADKEEGQ